MRKIVSGQACEGNDAALSDSRGIGLLVGGQDGSHTHSTQAAHPCCRQREEARAAQAGGRRYWTILLGAGQGTAEGETGHGRLGGRAE